jgi:lipoprotein NlpD
MTRWGGILLLALGLATAGCIPPSAISPASTAQTLPEPTLNTDPQLDALPDAQPVWEMRPVSPNAVVVAGGTYLVVAGDTLRSIGARTGAGSEALARANDLEPPYIIRIGQVLNVPPGRYHSVMPGETGIAIARAYGVAWPIIVEANALEAPFTLRVGQRLCVPDAETSPEARAQAFKLDIEDIVTGGEPATTDIAQIPPVETIAKAPTRSGSGFIWPAEGRAVSRFGPAGEGRVNRGIDISVPQSAPISASADGVVLFVGNDVANYGGLILVRHADGWITAYGRTSLANVKRGQSVERGQTIARAGTGSAPLLFFQMRKSGTPVDPIKQLPPR